MSYLDLFMSNKGTISSKLSKQIATQLLESNQGIPYEIVELCFYNHHVGKFKNIRSSACKIVELIAEERPEWVSSYLKDLSLVLEVSEAQSKWMIIKTFSYCADLNKGDFKDILNNVLQIFNNDPGLVLMSSCLMYFSSFINIYNASFDSILDEIVKYTSHSKENEFDFFISFFEEVRHLFSSSTKERVYALVNIMKHSSRKITLKRKKKFLDQLR